MQHSSHDPAFKRLFAHPELVLGLLALVPNCPIDGAIAVDRVNCSFVSSSDRQRYADMVWRVDGPVAPFYVLVEFQASIDRQMAQRMKVYFGLLSQDLGAQKKRELLDLLPVVVYSGRRKWPSAVQARADWLKSYQEGKVYFLIDEDVAGNSVIGEVIRLVRGDSLAEIVTSTRRLLAWPMASEELKSDVCSIAGERAALYGSNLEAIMEDDAVVRVPPDLTPEEKRDVLEMFRTIYMTLKDTPKVKRMIEARAEARRKGEAEGRRNGRREGRQEGRQEGVQEGRAEVLRELLTEACERDGFSGPDQNNIIAAASTAQLERWVQRLVAGEKLNEVLDEGRPVPPRRNGPEK